MAAIRKPALMAGGGGGGGGGDSHGVGFRLRMPHGFTTERRPAQTELSTQFISSLSLLSTHQDGEVKRLMYTHSQRLYQLLQQQLAVSAWCQEMDGVNHVLKTNQIASWHLLMHFHRTIKQRTQSHEDHQSNDIT